jgi:CRP-like cAMP-binding protein
MIGLLLRDYHEAEYLPKEEKELYLKYLAAEGMDKIDFMHLMARAQRQVVAPGQYFVKQGEMNYRVYYVANGSFEVLRDQDVAALLGPNTFVAEMGFVKWRDFMSQRQRVQAKKDEEIRRKETMIDFQAVSKELQRSLGYMGGTLATPTMEALEEEKAAAAKQQKATEEQIQQQQERQQARSWQTWLGMKPRGSAEQARSSYTDVDKDGCVLDPASGYKIDVVNDGIVSSADVRAKKECIVYSWKFSDLEELMAQRTGAALVLERSFSSDLSRKMRKHDIQHKYKVGQVRCT